MKRTLLDALKGLTVADAAAKVAEAGLTAKVFQKGAFITMQAIANTVYLWDDGGKVSEATSGGDEVE